MHEINYDKFSVLMSVYINETANNFRECMDSMFSQTVRPNEIVLVYDGPIKGEVDDLVTKYSKEYPDVITIVRNEKNKGLGLALADGVPVCKYDIIARMDTDDISRDDRFEIQLEYLKNHPEIDIVGSHILEFDKNKEDITAARKVPIEHDDIVKYQKKRSAFNHVAVMMKKEAVLKAGNYKDALLMEDDLLWADMIMSGARCANIDDYLVYVRVGDGMIERRGGLAYYKKYKSGRKKILETGFITRREYVETLAVQLIVALIPTPLRAMIFKLCLRQKAN